MVELSGADFFSIPTEQKKYDTQADIEAILTEKAVSLDPASVVEISLGGNSFG